MRELRFLCDECTPWALVSVLRQKAPRLDVLRVLEAGAPPPGTRDPDLLTAAQTMGRVLVTSDRETMPAHLVNHFMAGHKTAGVILMRQGYSIGRYAALILDFWSNDAAEDWVDRTVYIP
jgi:hypothetical protein